MSIKLVTHSACTLGLAAILASQSWAQQSESRIGREQLTQPDALVPPQIPHQNIENQRQWSESDPPVQEGFADDNRVGRDYQVDSSDYDAPPMPPPEPKDNYSQNNDESSTNASRGQPAELGVYMLTNNGPGVPITRVYSGKAADEAGLQPGDFILGIDGQSVGSPFEVQREIRNRAPGDTVELSIWRNGVQQTIMATLGAARQVTLQDESHNSDVYMGQYDIETAMVRGGRYQTYYRAPLTARTYGYYPGYGRTYRYGPTYGTYYRYAPRASYYGYPYRFGTGYFGAPRVGSYYSPWSARVGIGRFGYGW